MGYNIEGACGLCGKKEPDGKPLKVHHIDCNYDNHEPDNLVEYCSKCFKIVRRSLFGD